MPLFLGQEGSRLSLLRSLSWSGWARLCAAAMCLALPGSAMLGSKVRAETTLEARKLPMDFKWHEAQAACKQDCTGWIAAVGVITSDTPARFEEFASKRALKGAQMVLDSSGGSVLDAIALGRHWRGLGLRTTVGIVVNRQTADAGLERDILPDAYCESMCVFLLLSGDSRYVPAGAHVRVHQIWMGDRAENAKSATYSAEDMMIVERDIGRLAKYTFDMGGSGDLLSLALSVPPWEPLHELTAEELRLTNIVTTTAMAEAKSTGDVAAGAMPKAIQDRFAGDNVSAEKSARLAPALPTKTAEAHVPTGGSAPVASELK